jgi:CubicO group peptidase (beta-lactamase class C family)
LSARPSAKPVFAQFVPKVLPCRFVRSFGRAFNPLLWIVSLLATSGLGRAATSPSGSHVDEPAIRQFAASTVSNLLAEAPAPGGIFVVVGGGHVVALQTFGVSDLTTGQAVSADETLFRAASVSKILTTAVVLEQVDSGRLDLHADINEYLGNFQIPPAFGRPITLHDLLTHSAGFDVSRQRYGARTTADRLSLGDYLREERPDRLRPPGLFSSYSNYGFALAGYVLQRTTGTPFDEEMKDHLLDPLGMTHSSFSPGPEKRVHMATGHQLAHGIRTALQQDYVNITPAAGLCTTAADMSRFLLALTTNRRPDGSEAFPGEVLKKMTTTQLAADPKVSGRSYGFERTSLAGRPVLLQTGQWPGFNSALVLFPGTDCGLFLAYNVCDDFKAGERITRAFAHGFIAATSPDGTGPLAAIVPTGPFTGTFQTIRFPRNTVFMGDADEVDIVREGAGELAIAGSDYHGLGGAVFERAAELGETIPRTSRRLVFFESNNESFDRLVTESDAYRRVPWWNTAAFRRERSRSVAVILISALVLWPTVAAVRFMTGRAAVNRPGDGMARVATVSASLFCLLGLGFQAAFAAAANQLAPFALFYGLPDSIVHVAAFTPFILVGTAGLVVLNITAWKMRLWNLPHRAHYTLVVFAALHLCFEIFRRNLLSAL